MGRIALVTPVYLSVAWTLMLSYQIFTQTAVKTVVDQLVIYTPFLGGWLLYHLDMVTFVYAFAWVFVLSSIIPGLLLGRERSVFVQFLVCLTLALLGIILIDTLSSTYGFDLTNPEVLLSFPYMQIFTNVFFALFYLALPYIFMAGLDYNARKKRKQQHEHVKKITEDFFNKPESPKESPPLTGQEIVKPQDDETAA